MEIHANVLILFKRFPVIIFMLAGNQIFPSAGPAAYCNLMQHVDFTFWRQSVKWALWVGVFDIGLYRQAAQVLVISYRFLIKWATQKTTVCCNRNRK